MYAHDQRLIAARFRVPPIMAVLLSRALTAACVPPETDRQARLTLFVGIDVSGSFQSTGNFNDAIHFTAHYIFGHLNRMGDLEEPAVLFVGSIGGEIPGQPKSFHPIHDFKGKSVDEIEADLRKWFVSDDRFTDFNPFFERVSTLVKRQNLILKPVAIVVISDGVPDISARAASTDDDRYKRINLEPLEMLSRNVTVRLLYATPGVNERWERDIPRRRVRLWTVDSEVMLGWRRQVAPGLALDQQAALWQWVSEIVDFRVRRRII